MAAPRARAVTMDDPLGTISRFFRERKWRSVREVAIAYPVAPYAARPVTDPLFFRLPEEICPARIVAGPAPGSVAELLPGEPG